MREEPELVGFPAVARRTVGICVELTIFDRVLHPAAGAIDFLVEQLTAAAHIGDDEAYVGALRCSLDAGDDLALARPAFRLVAGLEEAARFVPA